MPTQPCLYIILPLNFSLHKAEKVPVLKSPKLQESLFGQERRRKDMEDFPRCWSGNRNDKEFNNSNEKHGLILRVFSKAISTWCSTAKKVLWCHVMGTYSLPGSRWHTHTRTNTNTGGWTDKPGLRIQCGEYLSLGRLTDSCRCVHAYLRLGRQ